MRCVVSGDTDKNVRGCGAEPTESKTAVLNYAQDIFCRKSFRGVTQVLPLTVHKPLAMRANNPLPLSPMPRGFLLPPSLLTLLVRRRSSQPPTLRMPPLLPLPMCQLRTQAPLPVRLPLVLPAHSFKVLRVQTLPPPAPASPSLPCRQFITRAHWPW